MAASLALMRTTLQNFQPLMRPQRQLTSNSSTALIFCASGTFGRYHIQTALVTSNLFKSCRPSIRSSAIRVCRRRELILNAVRLGALSDEDGQQTLKLAIALVEKYAPSGEGAASAVEAGLKRDFEQIPAEIVADRAVRLLKFDRLLMTGRELEMASYHVSLPPFDGLSLPTKSMLGALLDYAGVDRERFASAWKAGAIAETPNEMNEAVARTGSPQPSLFDNEGSPA